jgi:hypothetical protein
VNKDITIHIHRGTLIVVAVVTGMTLLLAASSAVAEEPGVEYFACVTNGGGLTQVSIGEATDCSGGKTPIHWNEIGPVGEVGPVGPTGAVGPIGPAGEVTWDGLRTERYTRSGHFDIIPGTGPQAFKVQCDYRDISLSGGWIQLHANVAVEYNAPSGYGWLRVLSNDNMDTPTGSARSVSLIVTCLDTAQ